MIICTMPECQTTAGCLCQKRGIISDPAKLPSRDYIDLLKEEVDRLRGELQAKELEAIGYLRAVRSLQAELANARNAALEEAASFFDRDSSYGKWHSSRVAAKIRDLKAEVESR